MRFKQLLNSKGQLTLDFLFASVLMLGITAILSALCFALTLTEVMQYVSFSGARAYHSGDLSESDQNNAAHTKVFNLATPQSPKALPFLSGALRNNWIALKESEKYGDLKGEYPEANPFRNQFVGLLLHFEVPMLNMKLPLLGPAIEASNGFSAKVASFLMREPTYFECKAFLQTVYSSILNLDGQYRQATSPVSSFFSNPDQYQPITDNGC